MIKPLLEQLTYNYGFDKYEKITLFNKEQTLLVTLQSYRESDGITEEQEKTYYEFFQNEQKYVAIVEKSLIDLAGIDAERVYILTSIVVSRDGKLALLFDLNNEEEGLAVQVIPDVLVCDQSEYL
ncbi:hypothetical protein GKS17_08195 [Streptococcus uberis]|uniref:hypothetical protein n=1 Tax=Streptococcus uberis TaxID=1349 RepID=UPI0012B5EB97|nr:hypothetical protein [Streptococcus uberis]MCK1198714.1 hypothetical protein [Streptococcus uberis]MCK1202935.1 hypothetical protein [Streptococcus uberis]MTC89836.1 hypothetical protein [Streptococcus uberis]MTC96766.1 hypothetical protein [Streptococcus uberis]